MSLDVLQVQAAPERLAGWLRRLLAPALVAARLDPLPVELRPTGLWAGWAAGPDSAPDGRVCLSNRIVLYSQAGLVQLYLHEASHALLHRVDPKTRHDHSAAFFALNAALLMRLDASGLAMESPASHLSSMGLYDLADPPPGLADQSDEVWIPRALGWALQQARELADADVEAQALAALIATRYREWCVLLADGQQARARLQREREVEAHRQLVRAVIGGAVFVGIFMGSLGAALTKYA